MDNLIIIIATGFVTFVAGLLTDSIKEGKQTIKIENRSKDYIIDDFMIIKNSLSEVNTVWDNTKNFLANKINHISDYSNRGNAIRQHIANLDDRNLRSDINILLNKLFRLSTEELDKVFTIAQPQLDQDSEKYISEYMSKIGGAEKEVSAVIEKIEKSKRKHFWNKQKK